MRRFRPLLFVLIIAGLAAGGYWLYRTRVAPGQLPEQSLTQIATASRGSIRETVSVVGSLEAVRRKNLQFERSLPAAPLVTLLVEAGDIVEAGQVLASIDPAPYQRFVEQARVDLAAAEARLARLRQPPSPLDYSKADLAISRAELDLSNAQEAVAALERTGLAELRVKASQAQTALAQARAELERLGRDKAPAETLRQLKEAELQAGADHSRLVAESYTDSYHQDRVLVAFNTLQDAIDARISEEARQAAALLERQTAVRKAERAAADATAALREAEEGSASSGSASSASRDVARARAALAVREAEASLAAAQANRSKLDQGPDPAKIAIAQTEVSQAQLALANAQAALDGAELKAPFAGTVLELYVAAGGPVGPKVDVLTLGDISELQVRASIDETNIRRVQAGQPAQIVFDALPDQVFAGQVKSVPLQGTLENGVRVFKTPLTLEDPGGIPVLVGMTGNVEIEIGQAEDVLLVPAMAVEVYDGVAQVLTPNPAGPELEPVPVVVEVGLSDGLNTEIISGLSEGDAVLVTFDSMPEGEFGSPMFWVARPTVRHAVQSALRLAVGLAAGGLR